MSSGTGDGENPLDGVPKPGEVLAGKYRVVRVLGVGGMGAVVAATHMHLGQEVAIKFLTAKSARDPRRVERFSREAWAAAKIKSEHIVRVSDVGALADGTPYMVMEYLEGEDLESMLQRGPVPIPTAIGYVLQAAEAIAEAHKNGIVHRDLKPGNLFVTKRADGSAWVKVLDFGISKISVGGQSLTQTSALLGSPLYMAPEQLASSKYVDHRADIWALSVVLFELITGQPPFAADTLPQVCLTILQGEAASFRQLRPDAPAELAAVLDRCLQKKPDDRFQDLAGLAVALAPFGDAGAQASASFIQKVLAGVRLGSVSTDVPLPGGDELSSTVVVGATADEEPYSDGEVPTAVQASPALDQPGLTTPGVAPPTAPATVEQGPPTPSATESPQPLAARAAPDGTAAAGGGAPGVIPGDNAVPAGGAAQPVGTVSSSSSAMDRSTQPGIAATPPSAQGQAAATGPVRPIGVVTADAVARPLAPPAKSSTSTAVALGAVLVLLLGSIIGLVVLLAGDTTDATPAATGAGAESTSVVAAPSDSSREFAGPSGSVEVASSGSDAAGGAGGAAASAAAGGAAATAAPKPSPAKPPPPRPGSTQPAKPPDKPWSPFDDR